MGDSAYPNILIVSHNLYDDSNNIGKTLVSLLDGWPKEKISQIYFRNDKPSFNYCNNYYCITDKEIVKSLITLGIKKAGQEILDGSELNISKTEENMYQVGNHRRPIVSFIRDTMWSVGTWKSKKFKEWIIKINPDVILFAPNDYTLAYRVVLYVEKVLKKPIIPFYMDDSFYYGCKSSILDRIRRTKLRKFAKKVHKHSNKILTICSYMSEEYNRKFQQACFDFVNSVNIPMIQDKKPVNKEVIFSYLGNLHSNRWKSLVEIGKEIDKINQEKNINSELRIYSGSLLEEEVKSALDSVKCIKFMGRVSASLVREKQLEADVLIHVEAFDRNSVNSTRLSLSTKIPEYLSTGTCVFAYGPENIASMRYLKDNNLAKVCTKKEEIKNLLDEIISDEDVRKQYANRGFNQAKMYHDLKKTSKEFQNIIREEK